MVNLRTSWEPGKPHASTKQQNFKNHEKGNPFLHEYYVHAISGDNFPTAAGLAFAASGFTALVFSLIRVCISCLSDDRVVQGQKKGVRVRLQIAVRWTCLVEDETGSGWERFVHGVGPASHWPDMKSIIPVVFAAKEIGLFYGWYDLPYNLE